MDGKRATWSFEGWVLGALIGVPLGIATACTGDIEGGTPGGSPGSVRGPDGMIIGPVGPGGSSIGPGGSPLPGAAGGAGTGAVGSDPNLPGGGSPLGPGVTCTTPAVGESPLRRLTHAEYDNAVRDLLGDSSQPARAFARDTEVGLFDNTASSQTVPELLADQYLEAAVTLAEGVSDVEGLLGCDPAGGSGADCVQGFVQRFGRRAFRRPLASAEVDRLVALYDQTRALSDEATGVRGVISAVLASPDFLFRPEQGVADSTLEGAKTLGPFELAARLASLIWMSVPDDELLDAAEDGQLETREQVGLQARRMMEDERAHAGLLGFYSQWLGLPLLESATKDPEAYPAFTDELRDAMGEETRRFVEHVLWEDDARLSTLLTAPYSFVNADLAELYGVPAPSGSGFSRVDQDPSQRRGVLTQASMLAAFASSDESSPVKRGKFVRVRVLCQDLPDPPADIPEVAAPEEGVSTRERFAMHTNNAACSGCHSLIDGLGFGLEAYDGIGAFRTIDHGVTVDSSGEVTATRDIDGPYMGGPELAMRLASSAEVRDCAPTQWLRFALGRRETAEDDCSLAQLQQAFADSGGDLRELMVALTQTDAFLNYRPVE